MHNSIMNLNKRVIKERYLTLAERHRRAKKEQQRIPMQVDWKPSWQFEISY